MTCSELCKWLAKHGISENEISIVKGNTAVSLSVYCLLNIFYHTSEQDIDGDSFLQLSSLNRGDLSIELDCKLTFGAYNKLRNVLNQAEGIPMILILDIRKKHKNVLKAG